MIANGKMVSSILVHADSHLCIGYSNEAFHNLVEILRQVDAAVSLNSVF